jgi:hypothetical protein
MQTDKIVSNYGTNKKVRAKIDKLLGKNSTIHSSLGTDSTQEERDIAHEETKKIAYAIYNICPIFAKDNFLEIKFDDVL